MKNLIIKIIQTLLEYFFYILVFLGMVGAVCLVAKLVVWSSLVAFGLDIGKDYWSVCALLCVLGILSIFLGEKNGK